MDHLWVGTRVAVAATDALLLGLSLGAGA
jgi:hypothetical protein